MRALALALLLLAPAVPARALGRADKGTSAAAFLKIPAGARPAAMGDAFGGLADDAHAANYNPAGLAFLEAVEAAATHDSHFQGLNHEYGVLAVPLLSLRDTRLKRNAWGVAAFSVKTLGASDIERRGLVETDAPVGTFGASDVSYALSYGRLVVGGLAAGGTVKLVEQTLDSANGRTAASDAGLLWRGGRVSAGAGWRNLGGKLALGSTAAPLPLTLYAGGSLRPAPGILLAVEVRLPRDDAPRFSAGAELSRKFGTLSAAARAGWNASNREADGFGGFTFGGGVAYGRLGVDFAMLPFGDLGAAYHTTIRIRF
ncbi:MAG: PorV/PorQ family protein [Elusimicrobia bacterium]|nr:PorV/PorQ family protein [Elusimicrobiota bacterium]